MREAILYKNPLCANCLRNGLNEKATEVDHILSIRNGGRMYHVDNLQPLCRRCHSSKTAKERGPRKPRPRATDDRGYPTPEFLEWKASRRKKRV